jgi:hypothetical protein
MKPITHALTFLTCFALTGCSWLETRQLDSKIEAKEKELATITEELTKAAGTELAASRQFQADLKYGAISEWARQVTNPLNITAVGVSGEGDLRYREGVYKVWIEVPSDSKI